MPSIALDSLCLVLTIGNSSCIYHTINQKVSLHLEFVINSVSCTHLC